MNAVVGAAAADDEVLPLQGLYLYLVRSGFPLSVRDYEDAVRALRLGHGIGSRQALLTLCLTLWARDDEEASRLRGAFNRFARPRREEVDQLTGAGGNAGAVAGSPPADPATGQAHRPREGAAAGPNGAPRAEFGAASEAGVALPSVQVRLPALQNYIFEPKPPLAMRSLVIAWRRYRLAQRSGPPVELDIEATVAEQCRTGWLLQPVLVPARRNQARLLLLVDASASMRAWQGLNAPLVESLRHSRLKQSQLFYFDNDPLEGLYEQASLGRAFACDEVLRAHGDAAVLVLGDAGAARGRRDRQRLAGTRQFVQLVRSHGARLAWLNPMPRARWGDAARPLHPVAPMEELGEDGLTRAIDFLRGARTA